MKLYCIYNQEADLYVKDSKHDTNNIDEAKVFTTKKQAQNFRYMYCDTATAKPILIERRT